MPRNDLTASSRRLAPWLLGLLLLAGAGGAQRATTAAPAAHASDALHQAQDLAALGRRAAADGRLLIVEFWAADCPYCRLLDERVLLPLQKSGEYRERALLVQLDINAGHLRDFSGQASSGQQLADRYRVEVTPTVLLLGPDGTELAPRLVGINSVDFYPAYLDAALEEAEKRHRAR